MAPSHPLVRMPLRILLALVLALTFAAVTSVDRSRAVEAPGSPTRPDDTPPPTGTVTLITGDRVTLGPARNGEPTVTFDPRSEDGGFSVRRDAGRILVIPDQVAGLVPEVLDPALFEVAGLVEMGYDDRSSAELPVIVRHSARVRTLAAAPLDLGRRLGSLGARAATLDKDDADDFGDKLAALDGSRASRQRTARALGGITKVWLDGQVESTELEGYLTQVGAPAAWETGLDGTGTSVAVLDTGVDAGHPALAGQVDAEENFTPAATADDGHGHGTHVASILAGTGAESGGTLRGIAPAADLLSGKVLDDEGVGQQSWVIAGMEWAVAQGADVVNLSLGGRAGYDDDPVVQALDTLTAESGTLFVVAAGNGGWLGEEPFTIESPGTAASALTVGAATDSDAQAIFSSAGPTAGSYRLKPDVMAPGVNIPGARAGARDGDFYLPVSGTSQATPIVAGAAGLVMQQHPDWSWEEVKAHLVTTSDPFERQTSWTHGGGRIDLQRATSQPLHSELASLDFGPVRHPDESPRTRTLTLTNEGDSPVTVDLTDVQTHEDGMGAPADTLTAAPASLTVPAGGSASSTISFDPSTVADGLWHGSLSVTADGERMLRLPFGAYDEPERYDLDLRVLDRRGEPVSGGMVELFNADFGGFIDVRLDGEGRGSRRVPPGAWQVSGAIMTPARGGEPETYTMAVTPELMVDSDTTHTLDARSAERLQAPTVEGQTTAVVEAGLSFKRRAESRSFGHTIFFAPEEIEQGRVFVTPTEAVAHGSFQAALRWRLEPDEEVGAKDPAVYELLFADSVLPSPLSPHLGKDDVEDLARIDQRFRAVSAPGEYLLGRSYFAEAFGAAYISWRPVEVPQRRVELVSADPDVEWRQCLAIPDQPVAELCDPARRSYDVGEEVAADWGSGLHPDIVQRWHSPWTLYLRVGLGDGGHVGVVDPAAVETSRLRLSRDGALVGERDGLSGYFPAPESGDFRLEHSWSLDPDSLGVATEAETVWEFTSTPPEPGVGNGTPPLLSIDYGARVDDLGRAQPRRALHFDVSVAGTGPADGARIDDLDLAFSTDGDGWTSLRTRRTGDNSFHALIPGGRLSSGDTVSVRASAHDADGNSIEQTVVGMIPVR